MLKNIIENANKGNTADRYAPADFFVSNIMEKENDAMKNKILTILTIILFILTAFLMLQYAAGIMAKYAFDPKTHEILEPQARITAAIILICIEIILCFITAVLAKKKNRNTLAWLVLNLFVCPLSFIVLFFLPQKGIAELDK